MSLGSGPVAVERGGAMWRRRQQQSVCGAPDLTCATTWTAICPLEDAATRRRVDTQRHDG